MSVELISAALDEIEVKAEAVGELIHSILVNGESVDTDVLTSLVGFARIGAVVSGVDVVDKDSLDEALKEAAIQMIYYGIEQKLAESGESLKEITDNVINLLGEELDQDE